MEQKRDSLKKAILEGAAVEEKVEEKEEEKEAEKAEE